MMLLIKSLKKKNNRQKSRIKSYLIWSMELKYKQIRNAMEFKKKQNV